MSELQRWSEDGATDAECGLLDASRAERAPLHTRTRTLQVLGLSTAAATAAVAATTTASAATASATSQAAAATATAPTATVSAATATWSLVTKVVGLSVLASGVVAGVWMVRGSVRASSTALHATTPTASQPALPVPSSPSPADPSIALAPTPSIAPDSASMSPPAPHHVRPPRSGPNDRLSLEVAALERAHQALASRDPDAALRLLDRYRAEFPAGTLASDGTVLRVQALLAKGDRAAARSLADAYSADHPDSPYAKRIEDLVRTERKR